MHAMSQRPAQPRGKRFPTIALALLAVTLAANGCAPRYALTVRGPKGSGADAALSVRELVLRNVLAGEGRRKIVFVSFGQSWIDRVDPPAGFLDRLADAGPPLAPASKVEHVLDPNSLMLVVRITRWESDTESLVAVTRFRFGVGVSDGFTARVRWADGMWRIVGAVNRWST